MVALRRLPSAARAFDPSLTTLNACCSAYKLKDSTVPARAIPPPSPPSPPTRPTRRGHQGRAFTRPPGVDDHSDSQRRPIPRRLRLRLFAEERPLGSLGSTLGSAERPSRGQLNTGSSPSFRFEILQVLNILLEAKAPLLADVPHGELAPLCMLDCHAPAVQTARAVIQLSRMDSGWESYKSFMTHRTWLSHICSPLKAFKESSSQPARAAWLESSFTCPRVNELEASIQHCAALGVQQWAALPEGSWLF